MLLENLSRYIDSMHDVAHQILLYATGPKMWNDQVSITPEVSVE